MKAEILEKFAEDVKGRRGRIQEVAQASGLQVKALRRIYYLVRDGKHVDPRASTIDGLRRVYDEAA